MTTAEASMHRITVASLSLLLAAALVGEASAADARKGETLAKRWCATCHIVSIDQQRGTTQSPPFSAIANRPEFDETKLAFFLLTPHPRMPDMNLSRSEAADLAAYIKMQK
jgi:mono/diheme cytochrome c family protein